MIFCGIGYMCKIVRKMKQNLYLNILKDEFIDIISTIRMLYFNMIMILSILLNQSSIGYQCKILMCLLGHINHMV